MQHKRCAKIIRCASNKNRSRTLACYNNAKLETKKKHIHNGKSGTFSSVIEIPSALERYAHVLVSIMSSLAFGVSFPDKNLPCA